MTSIEWLEEKMKLSLGDEFQYLVGFFTLAKEMHKQEIIDAFGDEQEHLQDDGSWKRINCEDYYNERFKK